MLLTFNFLIIMNELLKMSKGNKKLKNTLIFDLPAGKTCPMANECKSYVVMNDKARLQLKMAKIIFFDVMPQVKRINIRMFIKLENII